MSDAERSERTVSASASVSEKKRAGGGILYSLVSLLAALLVIAAVLGGFLFMLIRMNVLGVADTYRDSIQNIPVLNLALPKEGITDPNEMTFAELLNVYNASLAENNRLKNEINEANRRIEELGLAKSEYDANILINDEKTERLQQLLLDHEANRKQLDDMRYELERAAAAGDQDAFAQYFETVSPEVAQDIYAQIITERRINEEQKEFIKLFQSLDTKTSAQIIETLGSARLDFITDTLGAIKRDIAAEIIQNLSPEMAAQITLRLSGN